MLSLAAILFIYTTIVVPDNYKTIQDAVNKASTEDTIIVNEGTYRENIIINKPVFIMSRRGPDFTTVVAANPSEDVFKVNNTDSVEITGFSATGSLQSGIYLKNSNKSKIANNKTFKNGYGIKLYGSNNSVLTGNMADSNKSYGIFIEASDSNNVTKNSATSNGDNGIFLSSANNNKISDNAINYNTWNGILLWDSDSNTISDNSIWRNRFGIVISEGFNNTLSNNSTWSNIYLIMPLILAYIGIVSYSVQRRILKLIHRV